VLAAQTQAASLVVTVLKRDGQPLPGAVVTAEPENGQPTPIPPIRAIMDQVNLAFVPDVLVIPVHSTVQFPNSDAVSHQVYSFSSARRFQLPLYRGKPYPPVQFDQPGVVTLGCNIHDNMLAYIVVTAAPFFGRADDRGSWTAADLPEGRYRVRVWHPLLSEPAELLHRQGRPGLAELQGWDRPAPAPELCRSREALTELLGRDRLAPTTEVLRRCLVHHRGHLIHLCRLP